MPHINQEAQIPIKPNSHSKPSNDTCCLRKPLLKLTSKALGNRARTRATPRMQLIQSLFTSPTQPLVRSWWPQLRRVIKTTNFLGHEAHETLPTSWTALWRCSYFPLPRVIYPFPRVYAICPTRMQLLWWPMSHPYLCPPQHWAVPSLTHRASTQ